MPFVKPAQGILSLVIGALVLVVGTVQLATTVSTVDPATAPTAALVLFFASLWLTCAAVWYLLESFVLLYIRRQVRIASTVRHACLLSSAVTVMLLLSANQALTYLEIAGILVSVFLLELFFRAEKKIVTPYGSQQA